MALTRSIDLNLADRLKKDREFRREWFRAELETAVPEQYRDLRELRGLTQNDLAALTEMKQSAISRFEGSTNATWKIETLLKLAEALDARLIIGLERTEDVIDRIEREESGVQPPGKSAVTAKPIDDQNQPRSSILQGDNPLRRDALKQQHSHNETRDRPWS